MGCDALAEVRLEHCGALAQIDSQAFRFTTSLREVTFPVSVRHIATDAFAVSGLERLDLRGNASVRIMGNAFAWCFSLRELWLPDNVQVGDRAFQFCTGLCLIRGNEKGYVERGAFAACRFGRVSAPAEAYSVRTGSRMDVDTEPPQFVPLAEAAVADVSPGTAAKFEWRGVVAPRPRATRRESWMLMYGRVSSDCSTGLGEPPNGAEPIALVVAPEMTSVEGLIRVVWRYRITSLDLRGTGVREIRAFAFEHLLVLREVHLGDCVEVIHEYAFRICISLAEFTTGSGLRRVGCHAFQDCGELAVLRFPPTFEELWPSSTRGVGVREFDLRDCGSLRMACVARANYLRIVRLPARFRGLATLGGLQRPRWFSFGSVNVTFCEERKTDPFMNCRPDFVEFTALEPPRFVDIPGDQTPAVKASIALDGARVSVSNSLVFGEIAALWDRLSRPSFPP
jgi:hypothetical protein